MGRALMLLLSLLWTLACIPASWGLQCIRCESSASCREEECAPGHDLCRTTVLRVWEEKKSWRWWREAVPIQKRLTEP
jgi:plasminogen activator (urokinase receptor)